MSHRGIYRSAALVVFGVLLVAAANFSAHDARGDERTVPARWHRTEISYYGPGLWGGGLACGGTLQRGMRGTAHRTLPCGTWITVCYRPRPTVHFRCVRVRVIDRGPYIAGRDLDLTERSMRDLIGGPPSTLPRDKSKWRLGR